MTELPYVDEHAIDIAAPRERVWAALLDEVADSFGSSRFRIASRAIGFRPTGAAPGVDERLRRLGGFDVTVSEEPSRLVLVGRHHFSRYSLTFHLTGATRLAAETHAEFPGLTGALYRLAVIGSRGHAVAVRRILRHVRSRTQDAVATS